MLTPKCWPGSPSLAHSSGQRAGSIESSFQQGVTSPLWAHEGSDVVVTLPSWLSVTSSALQSGLCGSTSGPVTQPVLMLEMIFWPRLSSADW